METQSSKLLLSKIQGSRTVHSKSSILAAVATAGECNAKDEVNSGERAAQFTLIPALVLLSVDLTVVARMLKKRECYELDEESKQEVPFLKPTTYTANIDRSLLKSFLSMGAFKYIAPDVEIESLNGDNIKQLFKRIV